MQQFKKFYLNFREIQTRNFSRKICSKDYLGPSIQYLFYIIKFIPSRVQLIATMFSLVNAEIIIEVNLEKLRQKRCNSHNKHKATYFCTNHSCVTNSKSFLCAFCYKNHYHSIHFSGGEKLLFSTKRFIQIIKLILN